MYILFMPLMYDLSCIIIEDLVQINYLGYASLLLQGTSRKLTAGGITVSWS